MNYIYDKEIDMYHLHKLSNELKFNNFFINGLKYDAISIEYKIAKNNYFKWIENMYTMSSIYPISFSYIKFGYDIFQIEKLEHDLIILNMLY